MKFFFGVLCIITIYAHDSCALNSVPDYSTQLETEYKKIDTTIIDNAQQLHDRLIKVVNYLQNVSTPDKETIQKTIDAVQISIDTMAQSARDQLHTAYQQYLEQLQNLAQRPKASSAGVFGISLVDKGTILAVQLQDDISKMNAIAQSFFDTAQALATQTEQQARPLITQIMRQEAQKKIERQERMRTLLHEVAPAIVTLARTDETARKLLLNYRKSGVFPVDQAEELTKNYSSMLDQVRAVYVNRSMPISFSDRANYVTIIMQHLINFYCNDIAVTMQMASAQYAQLASEKKDRRPYYELFYRLALRLHGSDAQASGAIARSGYDSIIREQAIAFFGNDDAQTIVTYYMQKQLAMSQSHYINALLDFSLQITEPSAQDLLMAYHIYLVVFNSKKYTDSERVPDINKRINAYMAILYGAHAQYLLKSSVPSADAQQTLNAVIDAYKIASNYCKLAGMIAEQQQYQQLVTYLVTAQQQEQSAQVAQQQNNSAQAIQLYTQAYENFTRAGDAMSAQRVSTQKSILGAADYREQGKQKLADFLDTYKTNLLDYMRLISNVPTTNARNSFSTLLEKLQNVCLAAVDDYQKALLYYKEINQPTSDIDQAIEVLRNSAQAYQHLASGNSFVEVFNNQAFVQADNHYKQALNYAQLADKSFSVPAVAQLVAAYPTLLVDQSLRQLLNDTQTWNIQTVIQRHIAWTYIKVALSGKDENLVLALQAYENARERSSFVTSAVNTFLDDQRQQVAQQSEQIDMLYQAARELEQKAANFTDKDWQPDPKSSTYSSSAQQQWNTILNQYLSIVHMGRPQIIDDYIRAADIYAQNYNQYVPAQWYPLAGSAVINYGQYLALMSKNEQGAQHAILEKIATHNESFFNQARQALAVVQSADTQKALEQQKYVVDWINVYDQIIARQDALVAQFNQLISGAPVMWSKKTEVDGTTYLFNLPGDTLTKSITIAEPNKIYAQLYAQRAQQLFNTQDYTMAYQYYTQAQGYYAKLNQSNQAQAMQSKAELAYAWSLVDAYQNLIIPNRKNTHDIGMLNIAGLQIPQKYEIYNFLQQIPAYIPLPINLQQLAHDSSPQAQEQAESILQTYAYLSFVDAILKSKGIAFSDVFTPDLKPQTTPNVASDLLPVVRTALAYGQLFLQNLKQRLNSKQSSIAIQMRSNAYFISITYQPIFAIIPRQQVPITQLPFATFPTAQVNYLWAGKLSDPSSTTVQYGSQKIRSIQDKQIYTMLQENIGKAYLSAAYMYMQKVKYVMEGGDLSSIDSLINAQELDQLQKARASMQQLQAVKKDDEATDLAAFIETYKLLEMYINSVSITYMYSAAEFFNKQKNIIDALNTLISDAYVQLAQIAQQFLVGSPQAYHYFRGSEGSWAGVLADVQKYYQLAYALQPDRQNSLQNTIAELFIHAADWLVSKKNYFASLRYYKIAIAALQAINPVSVQQVDATAVQFLKAMFIGSTEKILQYRDAMLNPLTITLNSGQQETMTLQNLLDKIDICPSPSIDAQECVRYEQLRTTLLDALIYYQDCYNWASILSLSKEQLQKRQNTTVAQDPAVAESASTLVKNYIQKYSLSFDTDQSVIDFIKRSDFSSIMYEGFQQFTDAIKKATTDLDRKVGYAALQNWVNTLFLAFGKLYIAHYLEGQQGSGAVAFSDFINAIATERQSISAPAEQWLG